MSIRLKHLSLVFYNKATIALLKADPTDNPKTKKKTNNEAALPWSSPVVIILGPYIITMLPMYPLLIEKTAIATKYTASFVKYTWNENRFMSVLFFRRALFKIMDTKVLT